jgi:hypothetical protein
MWTLSADIMDMSPTIEPKQDRIQPPVGRPVLARFDGFRCVAVLGWDGKWRDYHNDQELPRSPLAWEFQGSKPEVWRGGRAAPLLSSMLALSPA